MNEGLKEKQEFKTIDHFNHFSSCNGVAELRKGN